MHLPIYLGTSLITIVSLSIPQFYPTQCCHSLFYIDLPVWRNLKSLALVENHPLVSIDI